MKIYTNKNNTGTLKLLIAANLAAKKVEIVEAEFEGRQMIFPLKNKCMNIIKKYIYEFY